MSHARRPLVSVVTPVYNGAHHLRGCVESVLTQTYDNWDYTIVNNCSTDGTLAIAQEYAARDPRIRVQTNDTLLRVIANYNVAFRHASPASTYCKVVAADDRLLPECLDRMVDLGERQPSVAIVGAYEIVGKMVKAVGLPYPDSVARGRDVCRTHLLGGPYIFGTPTTVLFRSDIVRSRHAFFNEANLHADDEACLEFLEHADFGFVHQILTYRHVEDGSLTSFSERINTYVAGLLHLLVRYGPKYLSDAELQQRIDDVLRQYYRSLARNVVAGRDAAFWRFHRAKLEELGYPMSRPRLAASVVSLALDLLLNPKASMQKLKQRTARAKARSAERSGSRESSRSAAAL